ncbi:MAG: hypothetical protein KIT17_01010 [Rubrivivax sp.]|nr:hypothetical protein [Rubrivivax sp.]
MQDTKPLPPAIERILSRAQQQPEEEPTDAEVREAYGEVRAPKTRGREALMLDVRKANGECHGLSYAYLMRVDFDPGDMLKLHFADATVQVGGRRLQALYRRLLEHRVEAIQEGTDAEEGLKPEDAAHIDRIELITPTEAEHDDQS